LGIAQWLEAPGQDIDAMCASFTTPDLAKVMYRGGQLNLLSVFNWAMLLGDGSRMNMKALFSLSDFDGYLTSLPLDEADDLAWRDVSYFDDSLNAPEIFETIASIDVTGSFGSITAPLLSIAGWYDMFLGPQLLDFQRMLSQGGGNAKSSLLIVGPWGHGPSGDGSIEFDNATMADAAGSAALMAWYDYWLRDRGSIGAMPKVLLYVMGDNVWRSEEQWPPARAVYTPFYLHSGGSANTAGGDGWLSEDEPPDNESADTFIYNPLNPAPTLGGGNLLTNVGPYDQQPVEARDDVLCYTTDNLSRDIEVTGPVSAVLYAETDALDTDFTVKLVDVYPDGRAINIQDGIARALYRNNDPLQATPLTPGAIERYDIDLWATSIVFKKGHRIRVEVSSSNFPRYNRNLNTGLTEPDTISTLEAHQSIYHTSLYPSHILLPVIPR
jgi:putative CocE/NonD family hydrolase